MTWEEFKRMGPPSAHSSIYKKTDIECPKCGKPLMMRTDIILTSYPAQYQYECTCGFMGYSFNKA